MSGAPPPQCQHLSPSLRSTIFCFVLLENSEVDDALESFALSKSLRLRLRLELDELVSFETGTGGGNIAAIGGGNTGAGLSSG